ncbi:MAG: oligosaccharide flippase family protein [Bacteroidetes bacterium]|nr:oligosaccharide flippase family protein [Bacteroidota bacterium]
MFTLLSGTTVAQAIPILISPILTRLYSPEEFGMLGLLIALVSIVSVMSTLRFELAIIQPKAHSDGFRLLVISVFCSIIISLISLSLVFFFKEEINEVTGLALGDWLYIIPPIIFLTGLMQSLNYWHNRNLRYLTIAKAKVIQSLSTVTANLVFFGMEIKAFGLIIGHMAGMIAICTALARAIKNCNCLNLNRVNINRYIVIIKKYRNFPIYSAPGALMDSMSLQAPVIFITKIFDLASAGFFNFVYRVVGGPLSIISMALSQVLLQKIATSKGESILTLVYKVALRLFLVSLPIFFITVLFGKDIFSFVFGASWVEAGTISSILIFSIVVRFIVSPLSMVLALNENIKLGVAWQLMYFMSILCVIYASLDKTFYYFVTVFVVVDVVLYVIYFLMIIVGAKRMRLCAE